MLKRPLSNVARTVIAIAAALSLANSASAAPKYKVLHAFGFGNDGAGLYGGLVFDQRGNLYGGTSGGGDYGYGTVYQLTRTTNGNWSESVLRSYKNGDPEGDEIMGTLAIDPSGNLYGTAEGGGAYHSGTAFELISGPAGWTETVLYAFCEKPKCSDGGSPQAGVIRDSDGNLYGTAGIVFELSLGRDGWRETTLHEFVGRNGDGVEPYGIAMDSHGNLYGTTLGGGRGGCGGGCGIAYELKHNRRGWKERVLHDFYVINGDGAFPDGTLILDKSGALYGTTSVGGSSGYGTVFRLTQDSNGHWKEVVVHSFNGGAGGSEPGGGVVMDSFGNLYGATSAGGDACGCGLVYKLAPGRGGKWKYTVLHRFVGSDGAEPGTSLILDDKSNIYGTTLAGGTYGGGVAFELTP
jgi:uncharacterized repeat protein (TIGR03803 family)